MKSTRTCLLATTLGVLACAGTSALAQNYPDRAIRYVVPFAAGGAGDLVARAVSARLSKLWGQQIIVDNRPGANGIIGTDLVAKSKPDGYTWVLGVTATIAVNPFMYAKLPYDANKDLAPVSQFTSYGYLLVVHPTIPAKNVKELIALGRAHPDQLSFATSGVGGSNHLAGELFKLMTGIKMKDVPFKGSGPALIALMAGEIPMMFDPLLTTIPHIGSGRLRAIGITLPKRSSSVPNIPTIAESGLPGYDIDAWQSVLVPAGTDRAIVNKISADVKKVLAMPDIRKQLIDEGGNELIGSAPEEFARVIASDQAKYRKLVAAAGLKAD